MNFKKSILYGILWWVVIFVYISIIGFLPFLATRVESSFVFNTAGWIVQYVLLVLWALIIAKLYFKGEKGCFACGVKVGVVFMVVSMILDAIVTVPLFVKDWGYFGDWKIWLAYVVSVILIGLGAKFFGQKKEKPLVLQEAEVYESKGEEPTDAPTAGV